MGVKAAGGIRTPEQAMEMLDAGASRIGTSNAAAVVEGYVPEDYLESAEVSRIRDQLFHEHRELSL